MMAGQKRKCVCGYQVMYYVISDAHDPGPVTQFVATELVGDGKGLPVATSICPRCFRDLTLESTTELEKMR